MKSRFLIQVLLPFALALSILGQHATIREQKQVIKTYPFSGPDPVSVQADGGAAQKIYPYFSFDDLAYASVDQTWNVIHLENPYIEAFVLPGAGGKLLGAVEKSTNKDFIYS